MKQIIQVSLILFCLTHTLCGIETKEELMIKLKAGIQQSDIEKVKAAITQDASLIHAIVPGTKYEGPLRKYRYRKEDKGTGPLEFALAQKEVNADIVLYLIGQESSLHETLIKKIFATNNKQIVKELFEKYSSKLPAHKDKLIFKMALSLKNKSLIDYITQKKFDITPEQATHLLLYAIENRVALEFAKVLVEKYDASITKKVGPSKSTHSGKTYESEKITISTSQATSLFAALTTGSYETLQYLLNRVSLTHLQQETFHINLQSCHLAPDRESRCDSANLPHASYLTIAILTGQQKKVDALKEKGIKGTAQDIAAKNRWVGKSINLENIS